MFLLFGWLFEAKTSEELISQLNFFICLQQGITGVQSQLLQCRTSIIKEISCNQDEQGKEEGDRTICTQETTILQAQLSPPSSEISGEHPKTAESIWKLSTSGRRASTRGLEEPDTSCSGSQAWHLSKVPVDLGRWNFSFKLHRKREQEWRQTVG